MARFAAILIRYIPARTLTGDFVQEIAVYDRNRKPCNWIDLIQPTQYAVFSSDAETGAEMNSDGQFPNPGDVRRCLIFESLTEAEHFCRQKVEQIPNLRCDLFDSHRSSQPTGGDYCEPTPPTSVGFAAESAAHDPLGTRRRSGFAAFVRTRLGT